MFNRALNTLPSSLAETLRAHYEAGLAASFPAFAGSDRESSALNASPYVTDYETFLADLGQWPDRKELLSALEVAIGLLRERRVDPRFALVGGSVLNKSVAPKDIDVAFFFTTEIDRETVPLFDLQKRMKMMRIDARLVAYDADPILPLKAVGFFATLYSNRCGADAERRGSVLLSFGD
jgi:hypothetical protein